MLAGSAVFPVRARHFRTFQPQLDQPRCLRGGRKIVLMRTPVVRKRVPVKVLAENIAAELGRSRGATAVETNNLDYRCGASSAVSR
jgi:hypothetical protein